jgi:hypothetical protein
MLGSQHLRLPSQQYCILYTLCTINVALISSKSFKCCQKIYKCNAQMASACRGISVHLSIEGKNVLQSQHLQQLKNNLSLRQESVIIGVLAGISQQPSN